MREAPGAVLEEVEAPPAALRLLVASEPWHRIFVQNLRDLVRPEEVAPLHLRSTPADFWPDVFVDRKLPWRRFLQSGGYHILALAFILVGSRWLALQPHAIPQSQISHSDVVYFSSSEYLPPLDTRRAVSHHTRKSDPELSAQPIISVPPAADNHSQTVVAAPSIQLQQDLALPNTVTFSDKPRMPIAPAPLVPASEISRIAPELSKSVIAPPPDLTSSSRQPVQVAQSGVIAPPPDVDATSKRRLGDLNIGRPTVIAPAPQLALDEQRTISGTRSGALRGKAPQVIAPPPSLGAASGSRSAGGMIALSLHPTVGAPPAAAAGNRRGSFAVTPEGHKGASGAPGSSAGDASGSESSAGKNSSGKLPSGLYVGKTSNATSAIAGEPKNSSANSVNPNLLANARPPRVTHASSEGAPKLSEPERAVFGGRKVYSLSLNMPNLNSAGGSWIIRFAAAKPDSPNPSAANPSDQDLSSPVATRKVDPAYPLELMRQNVSGTVILYGMIQSDGTVANVRVLRSVDDRLDRYASEAIVKWRFRAATKNGAPVDVEATFWIPFRPSRVGSNF